MTAFKTFKRGKTLDEIRTQCADQGLTLNTELYDKLESNYVVVSSEACAHARVLYSDFNGHFFGTTQYGVFFNANDRLDDQAWFAALLDFFNVNDAAAEREADTHKDQHTAQAASCPGAAS